MAEARDIVKRYFEARTSGDAATARSLLRDDLSFRGPFDTFDNADDYTRAIQGFAQIVERDDRRTLLSEGDEAVLVYDLVTKTPAGTAPVAEWYRVRDGRIAAIQAFFDARPFAAMREA